jgi:PKHD-type hydroxylase
MNQTVNMYPTDNVDNWAWADVFTPKECKEIIDIGNRVALTRATISKPENHAFDLSIRDSDISWLWPNSEHDWIFEKITGATNYLNENYFNFHLSGFAEGLQFTRYVAPTGHYDRHIDKAFQDRIRKLSLTIQLSSPDDYEDGELMLFYDRNTKVMPKEQGRMIAFPSYTLHQVAPVTVGTRYSLVAWLTGEAFK